MVRTVLAAAGLVLSLSGLTACGGSGSSAASGGSAPQNASKADFCSTFDKLSSTSSPKQVSASLAAVGTPSSIGASARRGFEVLVDELAKLPDKPGQADITRMTRDFKGTDQADFLAFFQYFTQECGLPSGAPSSLPTAPPS